MVQQSTAYRNTTIVRKENNMDPTEVHIITVIQIIDSIIVAALPWLKWLAVVGYSALVWALNEWKPP